MKIKRLEKMARERGIINNYPSFNYFEILDVVRLVANNEYPNGEFGDNECNLWSAIKSIMANGENSNYIDESCKSNK